MRKLYLANLLIVMLLGSMPANGDGLAATAVLKGVGNGTADQVLADTKEHVEVTASSDSSRVSLRIGSALSEVALPKSPKDTVKRARFTTWNLTASAPLDKSSDLSDLANQDGLANAFKASLALTSFSAELRNPYSEAGGLEKLETICRRAKEEARNSGLSESEMNSLECDAGTVGAYRPDLLDQWNDQFWNRKEARYFWGLELSVGHEKFDFLDSGSLEKLSDTKAPWAAKVFYSVILCNSLSLLTFGLEYQDAYKASASKTLCPNDEGKNILECTTGPVGEPSKTEKDLAFVNWRRLSRNQRIGVSLYMTYDFESDVFGADLPIFFVRNQDKSLTGGVRIGWRDDTDDVKVGVFVGKSLALFN